MSELTPFAAWAASAPDPLLLAAMLAGAALVLVALGFAIGTATTRCATATSPS